MGRYLLKRLLIAIPSLLGISVILFTVLALAPGDPFGELATNPAVPPEVRAALRVKFGLDDPVVVRYFHWLAAMRPYSIFDQITSTLAFIGFSLPTFFTGLLFILIFSVQLDWLPFVYSEIDATGWQWLVAQLRQSIMPISVLGLFQAASMTRYVRSATLDVIRLDYVTTARAKGLNERVVVMKHVVRNALIPVVTLVALQMPAVFGGAIVTEQIFRIPGIGSLLIDAILRNDTPVIMAVTFVFSCLVILFNLIADLLYGWLDPRISYR
jgi:peptide/nickel transport system permease protein